MVSAVRALGHDITAINYQPVIVHDAPRRGWREFIPSLGKLRMQGFVCRHIPVSGAPLLSPGAVDAHVDGANYDALICGSDQVWRIFGHQGIDRPCFLGVGIAPGLRHISYAPSAGSRRSFGGVHARGGRAAGPVQNISVRDANTAAALDEAGITGAVRVVDPTLIADFTPMLKGSPDRRDIVVTGRMDAAAERYIRFAAQKLGCKVRAIGTRCGAATDYAQEETLLSMEYDTLDTRLRARIRALSPFSG